MDKYWLMLRIFILLLSLQLSMLYVLSKCDEGTRFWFKDGLKYALVYRNCLNWINILVSQTRPIPCVSSSQLVDCDPNDPSRKYLWLITGLLAHYTPWSAALCRPILCVLGSLLATVLHAPFRHMLWYAAHSM